MKEFKFDHEVVVEQTLSYLFGARSILNNIPRDFDVVFSPQSHHLYSGILQAASYGALKNKNKIILIFEGNNDDKILVYNKSIGPFLGKKRKFDKSLEKLKNKFDFLEFSNYGKQDIYSQLPYLRMFLDIKNLMCIFVGSKIKNKDFLSFISKFDIKSDFNLAFISDIDGGNTNNEVLIKDPKTGLVKINNIYKNTMLNMFYQSVKVNSMTPRIFTQTDYLLTTGDKNKSLIYLSAGAR